MLNFIEPFEADVKSFRVVGILRNLITKSEVKCVVPRFNCLENIHLDWFSKRISKKLFRYSHIYFIFLPVLLE